MPSPFPQGTKLGRYEIRSQLGAGGMGEVYLALDSDLNRKVALKVLPEDFATKPHAMQRFIQEAKAASGLNHPNIITNRGWHVLYCRGIHRRRNASQLRVAITVVGFEGD